LALAKIAGDDRLDVIVRVSVRVRLLFDRFTVAVI
jgi:hypothetical protein